MPLHAWNPTDKDALISYKFRWTDADVSPTDNQLSKEEFMVFRHPEHSKSSLDSLVTNVLQGLGKHSHTGLISVFQSHYKEVFFNKLEICAQTCKFSGSCPFSGIFFLPAFSQPQWLEFCPIQNCLHFF